MLPLRNELIAAIQRVDLEQADAHDVHWRVRIDDAKLHESLGSRGVHVDNKTSSNYIFYKL
ncbi:hypothetical protein ALQ04_02897 [Pseudomonas cichorii]|uniref:Uncharacterized protein n=1 Tax=Pseudomonas cichorii TaxID=36746 RepID=A0A3M4M9P3_PSECI|nr:hypothetical protein [Pseudomonas cichorii]RMQ50415.1 hypothetical protein ALQ04_02897 [Pseudomonas cichorii]